MIPVSLSSSESATRELFPLGLAPQDTDTSEEEGREKDYYEHIVHPVGHRPPSVPAGAQTDTNWARMMMQRWRRFERISSNLRAGPRSSRGETHVIPGVTHEVDSDWATIHPRGRANASDPWAIMQNLAR